MSGNEFPAYIPIGNFTIWFVALSMILAVVLASILISVLNRRRKKKQNGEAYN